MARQLHVLREPSKQRAVALWKDQEDKINQLVEKHGKKLNITDLVREGVDLILAELDIQLSSKED